MTIAWIVALISAFAALVAQVSGHNALCGLHIFVTIIFVFAAMVSEGRMLNRIKKLEEELDILKRRY